MSNTLIEVVADVPFLCMVPSKACRFRLLFVILDDSVCVFMTDISAPLSMIDVMFVVGVCLLLYVVSDLCFADVVVW
jgi:hypothetical protein